MFLGRAREGEVENRQRAASTDLWCREGGPVPIALGEILMGIPDRETIPALDDGEVQANQRECRANQRRPLACVLCRIGIHEELVPATQLDHVLALEPGDLAVQDVARLGSE